MSYFGLPYIHAVFDVLAWLASMTVFWLDQTISFPPTPCPQPRAASGAYAITAGAGALCGAMFFGTANALLSGLHALASPWSAASLARFMAIEAYKRFTASAARPHRLAAPFAPRGGGRWAASFPASPTSPTARRPACLGRRFRRRHRPPSGAALRSLAMAAMFVVLIQRFEARDLLAGQRLLF